MFVRAFSSAYLLFALFFSLYLFVRTWVLFFSFSRGGVAAAATNAHLFSAFNSVFAVFFLFSFPAVRLVYAR